MIYSADTSHWFAYRPVVTVVDVLESGACLNGVKAWVAKNKLIAGPTAEHSHPEIQRAARADGYGDGYGDGDGDGYGYGYGDGDGDGYGYGYGDGDGYGE